MPGLAVEIFFGSGQRPIFKGPIEELRFRQNWLPSDVVIDFSEPGSPIVMRVVDPEKPEGWSKIVATGDVVVGRTPLGSNLLCFPTFRKGVTTEISITNLDPNSQQPDRIVIRQE